MHAFKGCARFRFLQKACNTYSLDPLLQEDLHKLGEESIFSGSCISLWLPKATITTVHFLTSFKAAFSRYRIDIGSVQNMYQADFLFSLESHQIDLIRTSNRKWYDIYQVPFGGGK